MSLFDTLFGKAREIISSGKSALSPVNTQNTQIDFPKETVSSYSPMNPINLLTAKKPLEKELSLKISGQPLPSMDTAQSTKQTTYENPINVIKEIGKGVVAADKVIARPIVKGTAEFALSAGESIPRLVNKKASSMVLPPTEVPGLSKYIGPVQSFQSKAAQAVQDGQTPSEAIKTATIDTLINDPAAVTLKPFILGLGLFAKAGRVAIDIKTAEGIAKSNDVYKISDLLDNAVPGLKNSSERDVLVDALTKESDPKKVTELINNTIQKEKDKAFATLGITDKNTQEAISSGKINVQEVLKKQRAAQDAARGERGVYQRLKDSFKEAKSGLVDFTAPITDAQNAAKKGDQSLAGLLKTNPEKDVNYGINNSLVSTEFANRFIQDNGLADVIQNVDDLYNFDDYLTAKHTIDLDTRGIEKGKNLAEQQAIVAEFGPKYEEAAQKVYAYNRALLDYVTDAGLVSSEVRDALKARYPNYVPLPVIIGELEKGEQISSKAVASLGKQTVVQNIKGSTRATERPIYSIIDKTNQAFKQAEKNKAAQMIVDLAKTEGNPLQLRKVGSTGEVSSGMGHISVYVNGKKEIWETTTDIANAAKALDVQQLDIVSRTLSYPTRIARLGITGINPAFILANFAKDQLTSFIFGEHGLRTSIVGNPYNFLRSFWAATAHDGLYEEWLRSTGGGTSFELYRNQIPKTVENIRAGKSLPSRALYTITHPGQITRALENIASRTEEATRIQNYRGYKNIGLEKGMSEASAKAYGAEASRKNTVNFRRRGDAGSVLNNAILYLNANIQGSRQLVTALKERPVETSTKIAVSLLTPAAAFTYWNLNDPDRKKVYDSIPEWEKENNFVYVIPGTSDYMKIPLPAGVGKLTTLVRRPIEQSQGLDPVSFGEIANALTNTVSPIDPSHPMASLPTAFKPAAQYASNYDFFTGQNTLSKSEEQRSVQNQYRSNTSGTAKTIADKLGLSPIKTEKFITDTGGEVSKNVLNTLDRIFTPDQVGGKSFAESISGRFKKTANTDSLSSAYDILSRQNTERADAKFEAEKIAESFSSLSGEEKKSKLIELAQNNPQLAKKVLDVIKDTEAGIGKEDRLIKMMGVENNERAQYVLEKLKTIAKEKGDDAAKEYLISLVEKKSNNKRGAQTNSRDE